eukprot:CAMPEP_0119429978 /NCGR_PEP_ID=MMETSP1335-20130426/43241_1 /TAXON_ID=259385 /ORGANISM="Chrysoculter rhomboideus, Strain RCC1486" /LENGTH=72 /DNA_ID=CAMNT_0007455721 /DNA_START=110 /DNA_END=325 /DNA_ORIENTATION=-
MTPSTLPPRGDDSDDETTALTTHRVDDTHDRAGDELVEKVSERPAGAARALEKHGQQHDERDHHGLLKAQAL